ncbi:methionyl-tRNA formyltransferase [Corynebacterium mendelii]|uniref:Methionyl-tRNA formyltransferase n=1 Tax=Corynebacterium mendelii TaxID=2765362 RepID=A0A939E0V8_9CORY|nr:methionyl-tRNA formyltransferase [Corynebacterium mendelii]MBN9643427.1 methionyl-tRNA formyltransferase [Corynebacterium mendelii]
MRLVFAGTPTPAAHVLAALAANPRHEIAAVITRPDARRGRGRTLHPSACKQFALEHGIDVFTPQMLAAGTDDGDEIRRVLAGLEPDCLPVVAYGALIPEDLLAIAPHGWVNLHFSLLPRWRGAAPVQSAIAAGDTTTGATTFRIDKGLDTGPILAAQPCPITGTDTAGSLLGKLADCGAELLSSTMDGLADGRIVAQPQPAEGVTHAGKITTADARIDWSAPATTIDRMLRAVTPAPGAWTMAGDRRIKIGRLTDPGPESADTPQRQPGQVIIDGMRLIVATGTTPVEITRIQPPGKPMMDADAFVNGNRDIDGMVLQ